MNFIENESPQKLRGGFYTEPDIARFLSSWVLAKRPTSVLEPSCGDGAFLEALAESHCPSLTQIIGYELDAGEAAKAKRRVRRAGGVQIDVHPTDFLKWFVLYGRDAEVGGVVGNPPFIRYQYLAADQQFLAEKIFARFRLPFTKHTNAWVPFVIASVSLLGPGARLAMVLPSEIFHIPHAQSLRSFLATHCSRILVFDPEELWFGDALQGVVLLLAEKKETPKSVGHGVAVQPVKTREILRASADDYFRAADFTNGSSLDGKWMRVFLSKTERSLLRTIEKSQTFPTFANIADVDVGIVTGANKFFLVSDETVARHELEAWAHPMFGRSEHVAGVIYGRADHNANREAGLPTNFLWFDVPDATKLSKPVMQYLRMGEEQGLPKRFKCRVRTPWFRVPSVHSTPVAMLKRAHHFPRLVLNRLRAFTTDTAYRIRPKSGVSAEGLVWSFLNSLTCLSAELEGRHYGGGVLELVPSEIERLIVPYCTANGQGLGDLDARFRNVSDQAALLRQQDQRVLRQLGLSRADSAIIHEAWDRLRNRRQRRSVGDASD